MTLILWDPLDDTARRSQGAAHFTSIVLRDPPASHKFHGSVLGQGNYKPEIYSGSL